MTTLNDKTRAAVIAHGEATYPHECCGFLFGSDKGDSRHISEYLSVENRRTENRERRFQIAPEDYLKAERYADEHGLELLGIYHSHPDHPAIPSEHDRRQAMPFFSYFIVSVMKGEGLVLRSWLLDKDFQFQEELITESITQ
jgi:proteasome lid subunit RPN8/RPN11